MVNAYLRQSPLAHLHLEARHQTTSQLTRSGITLSERPYATQIVIRGQTTDPAFVQGIEKALSVSLPVTPCTSSGNPDSIHILWMGPDEWLVIAPAEQQTDIYQTLRTTLSGLHTSLVDVSESRAVIHLGGKNALDVLAKGCSIDLHPSQFPAGQTVNTLLAKAHIILYQPAYAEPPSTPVLRLFIARSYAEYLWSWLEDASREFGLQPPSA